MDIRGEKISELMLWAVGKAKEKCYITAAYQDGNFIMEAAGDRANLFALGCGIVKELAKADKDYEAKEYVDVMAMTIKMELETDQDQQKNKGMEI